MPAKAKALLFASAFLPALAVQACGGSPPPAPLAPAAPAKAAPVTPLPPMIDLGAVPAPANLVLSGRLGKPAATLALAHEWTQLPLAGAEQITELVAGEALGPIVDLDAPIDLAVATSGEGMRLKGQLAVSAGVTDPDNVRATLGERYRLVPRENGVLLIQGLGAGHESDDDTDDAPGDGDGDLRACEVAPSFGTPAVRLVCASDTKALAELGPWLTRTAPRDAPRDDLRLDVRMAPLRSTLVTFRRMAAVMFGGLVGDGAGGTHDAVVDLATEFLDFAIDMDTASLALDADGSVAHTRFTATFTGNASTITRIAKAHADGGSEPPRAFWQLPADTDVAAFERGVAREDLTTLSGLVLRMLDGKLEEDGVKDADRKAVLSAIEKLPSPSPALYAGGLDLPARAQALAAQPSAGDSATRRADLNAMLGWRVFAVEESPSRITGALKDLAAAFSRPGVAAAYARSKTRRAPSFRVQPLPASPALPKGAARYALELPLSAPAAQAGKPPRAPPATVLQVLVAPAGSRTWVGIGGDAASMASRLAAAIASPGAARTDLASFEHARVGSAGFFEVRSVPAAILQLSALTGEPEPMAIAALAGVARARHKGLTPIPFSLTAQPDGSVVAALDLPREAVEDAVFAGLTLVGP